MLTCDYCDQPAAWMSALTSSEPLCKRCAKDHYESEWRASVRKIGKRDLALAGLASATDALITNTGAMIKSAT